MYLTRPLGSRVLAPLGASLRKKAGAHRTLNLNSQVMYDQSRTCSIPTAKALEKIPTEPNCWKKPCASNDAREERRAWRFQCLARSLPGPRPRSPSNRKKRIDTITYTMILSKGLRLNVSNSVKSIIVWVIVSVQFLRLLGLLGRGPGRDRAGHGQSQARPSSRAAL